MWTVLQILGLSNKYSMILSFEFDKYQLEYLRANLIFYTL